MLLTFFLIAIRIYILKILQYLVKHIIHITRMNDGRTAGPKKKFLKKNKEKKLTCKCGEKEG